MERPGKEGPPRTRLRRSESKKEFRPGRGHFKENPDEGEDKEDRRME